VTSGCRDLSGSDPSVLTRVIRKLASAGKRRVQAINALLPRTPATVDEEAQRATRVAIAKR